MKAPRTFRWYHKAQLLKILDKFKCQCSWTEAPSVFLILRCINMYGQLIQDHVLLPLLLILSRCVPWLDSYACPIKSYVRLQKKNFPHTPPAPLSFKSHLESHLPARSPPRLPSRTFTCLSCLQITKETEVTIQVRFETILVKYFTASIFTILLLSGSFLSHWCLCWKTTYLSWNLPVSFLENPHKTIGKH